MSILLYLFIYIKDWLFNRAYNYIFFPVFTIPMDIIKNYAKIYVIFFFLIFNFNFIIYIYINIKFIKISYRKKI